MNTEEKTVLVIDDDANCLATTKELLEGQGYRVITYERALGATTLVAAVRPNLVLLDINMPALSGENLARIITSNNLTRGVPIVFHSSNDEDSLRKAVKNHNVEGYISKGNLIDLREKVAYYLSRQCPS